MVGKRHSIGGALAVAACTVGASALFAFTPVELDWKFEGYVAPDASDSEPSVAAATMELGGFASDEAAPAGADEFIFRSWDFGEAESDVRRNPPSGMFILIR